MSVLTSKRLAAMVGSRLASPYAVDQALKAAEQDGSIYIEVVTDAGPQVVTYEGSV